MLFSVINLIQSEVLLNLFEIKEDKKEDIKDGYIRFIKGQYGIDINEFIQNETEADQK